MPNHKKYSSDLIQIDEDDRWILQAYTWTITQCGDKRYVRLTINKKKTYLHRFLMRATIGQLVDHRDMDGLNNRRFNIRVCTKSQNMMNRGRQINNTSGYKGVTRYKSSTRWRAYIKIDNKVVQLGTFETKEQASQAYNDAAILLHRDFARVN
jgi:hypothetical protein